MKSFKRLITAALTVCICTAGISAMDPIKLNEPNLKREGTLMQALKDRRSIRDFSETPLSHNDLSDLMWAAYGINRPDGRHTAASGKNMQDIDVYVFMAEGTYLYEPKENLLKPIAEGDSRALVAGPQKNVAKAPVMLLMVSDPARFEVSDPKGSAEMGAIDAGLVSQNIALFCSANGLATVPRYTMDRQGIRKLLSLPERSLILLNNPVGYPAK